jgi:hypothetical protein
MRIALALFLWLPTSLMPRSSSCQPFSAEEMRSAREAARSYVIRKAGRVQESPGEGALSWGLTRDRLAKMANGNLGDPVLVYSICADEIGKVTEIDRIYTAARLIGVAYPVLIDDRVTLMVGVTPSVDSTTKELAWKMSKFGGGLGPACRVECSH